MKAFMERRLYGKVLEFVKAENMFKFIQKEHSNLVKLQNDELIEPIFDIVNKVKNHVQPNGK